MSVYRRLFNFCVFIYKSVSCINRLFAYFFFLFWMSFISLACIAVLAKTSNTVNQKGKSEYFFSYSHSTTNMISASHH